MLHAKVTIFILNFVLIANARKTYLVKEQIQRLKVGLTAEEF
jgi:hypothetical protein